MVPTLAQRSLVGIIVNHNEVIVNFYSALAEDVRTENILREDVPIIPQQAL